MYKTKKHTIVRCYSDITDMQGVVDCISKYLLAQPIIAACHDYTIMVKMDVPGHHGIFIQDHEEDFNSTTFIPEE